MEKLLIRNVIKANESNPTTVPFDVLVQDGMIADVGESLPAQDIETVFDARGTYISHGLMDIHVHVSVPGYTQFHKQEMGVDIEQYGYRTGVNTLVDAGTFGADNIQAAIDYASQKITKVLFLINASRTGIQPGGPELEDLDKINIEAAEKALADNPERIIGVKARASISASGKSGITAIARAKALAVALGLPMVVHIGNAPPPIEEVLNLLTEGDIITHCFHGKRSNAIIDENNKVKPETLAARDRGVLFDVGHGSESFNYAVAQQMFQNGFLPDSISTDLHVLNARGPVYSLPVTVDKLMTLNDSLYPWINMATEAPRKAFKMPAGDPLAIGQTADLALFRVEPAAMDYLDSDGNSISIRKKINVIRTVKGSLLLPVDRV
jgi:dihydroorotase